MGGCHLESGFLSFSVLCSFLWQSIFRQQYAGQTCFPLAHCSPLGVPLVVSPLACPGLSFHGALANTQQCLAHPTTNGLSHREAKKLGHVKALGGALAERSHKHESLAPLEGRRKAPRTHQPSYPERHNPSASQGWTDGTDGHTARTGTDGRDGTDGRTEYSFTVLLGRRNTVLEYYWSPEIQFSSTIYYLLFNFQKIRKPILGTIYSTPWGLWELKNRQCG